MTNSLGLTYHVLLVRDYMFGSLVTIIRPSIKIIYQLPFYPLILMYLYDRYIHWYKL